MALVNPNIALGIQPVQLADPMAQYGKIAAIQSAQNQNALAQYQLGTAQRAEKTQNALAEAYAQSVDPATGKIDYNKLTSLVAGGGAGAQLPAIQKSRLEYETAQTTQQKAQSDLLDAKLKQSRGFLDTIDPADPTAPAKYLAWHEANHKDPIIGAALTARGVSAEQARQSIMAAIEKGPQAFAQMVAQSKLGTEKFMEMNKPTLTPQNLGGTAQILQTPGLGGAATVVPGSVGTTTMTPAQIQANKIAQQQLGVSQGQLKVAQDRLAQEGQGVTYQTDEQSNLMALPSRLPAGVAPMARPVIGEGGVAIKGAPKSKDIAVSEQQAAYNIGRVLTAANEIKKIGEKDPRAIQPGAGEALAASVGMSGTANLARNANRQIVRGAQRDALDALLYLATGAAYNKEQLEGQMEAYIPAFTDEPETLVAKKERMTALIKSAKTRAGKAWSPEMDASMKALTEPISAGTPSQTAAPAAAAVKISGDADYNKLPPGALFIGPDGQQRRKP